MAPPEAPRTVERRDVSSELERIAERLNEAQSYLGIDALRTRRGELETEASRADLWDDPERGRVVTSELGRVADDLDRFDALVASLGDARAMDELIVEAASGGAPDEALATELEETLDDLDAR